MRAKQPVERKHGAPYEARQRRMLYAYKFAYGEYTIFLNNQSKKYVKNDRQITEIVTNTANFIRNSPLPSHARNVIVFGRARLSMQTASLLVTERNPSFGLQKVT